MRVLTAIVLTTMVSGAVSVILLGWVYEGPRRLLVRLKGKMMKVFKCAG